MLANKIGDSKGKSSDPDADPNSLWESFLCEKSWSEATVHNFASAWETGGFKRQSVMEILAVTTKGAGLKATMATAGKLTSKLSEDIQQKCFIGAIRSGNVDFVDGFMEDLLPMLFIFLWIFCKCTFT